MKKIINKIKRMFSPWTVVKDRLPPKMPRQAFSDDVLTYYQSGGFKIYKVERCTYFPGEEPGFSSLATHWRPLPKEPRDAVSI
jgi:hypothetical protein